MRKFLLILTALFGAVVSMTAQNGCLIREDRVWEYEGSIPIGPWFQYKMRFDGDTVVDGTRYNILHTFDGITKEGPEEAKPAVGLKFMLREENGKVYVLVDNNVWSATDKTEEQLLYDFNAKTGDELNVIGNIGYLVNMTITSTYQCSIREEDCKVYTMNITDCPYAEYTVVEGMGNVTQGCIPLIITTLAAGYGNGSGYILPLPVVKQQLKRVYDNEGNVVCEKDSDSLWPWEKTDGMAEVEMASQPSFDGKTVSASSGQLAIYAISGEVVANGIGEVSTESLLPGVYIAKAGSRTLKIVVR